MTAFLEERIGSHCTMDFKSEKRLARSVFILLQELLHLRPFRTIHPSSLRLVSKSSQRQNS